MAEDVIKKQVPAFLEKLFDILEEGSPYSHLISWQPDGTSFIIKKVNEFSEVVLPRYFKHSNIQSYIRQLNMYGFSKTRQDSNHREFTHKLFQRGRRDLLHLIKRKTQISKDSTALVALTSFDSANIEQVDDDMSIDGSTQDGRMKFSAESSVKIIELESRVEFLENQLTFVSSALQHVLEKHNNLCEAVQQGKCVCSLDVGKIGDDAKNKKRKVSEELSVQPLRRMPSLDGGRGDLFTTVSLHNKIVTSSDSHSGGMNGTALLPVKLEEISNSSSASSTSSSTSSAAAISRLIKPRSNSVDLGGLDAIANAAVSLLDCKSSNGASSPLLKGAGLTANSSMFTHLHGMPLQKAHSCDV